MTGALFSSTTRPLTVWVWAEAAVIQKTADSDKSNFFIIGENLNGFGTRFGRLPFRWAVGYRKRNSAFE